MALRWDFSFGSWRMMDYHLQDLASCKFKTNKQQKQQANYIIPWLSGPRPRQHKTETWEKEKQTQQALGLPLFTSGYSQGRFQASAGREKPELRRQSQDCFGSSGWVTRGWGAGTGDWLRLREKLDISSKAGTDFWPDFRAGYLRPKLLQECREHP